MVAAQELRERIAFDKWVEERDEAGGINAGFVEQFIVWGHFRYLRGGESVQAARLVGQQPVVITVRYSATTKQADTNWIMRNVRTGEKYNIRSGPVPAENNRFIEFTAQSGVAIG